MNKWSALHIEGAFNRIIEDRGDVVIERASVESQTAAPYIHSTIGIGGGSLAAYKKALELDPDFDSTHGRLHDVYVQKRMYDLAIAEYVASYKSLPQAQEGLKAIYAASGIRGVWESSVAASQEQIERCCSRYIAGIYALLGDKENALKWLEKAYLARSHMMVDLKVDPVWDGLRSDPRFTELLRRMRLEP